MSIFTDQVKATELDEHQVRNGRLDNIIYRSHHGRIQSRLVAVLALLVLSLSSCDSSSENTELRQDDPNGNIVGELPSAPGNLHGVVYTDTEIEIFWSHATDDKGINGYDIYVGTEFIQTEDTLSFYQNDLLPDTTYEFTVVAVDSDDQRGPATSIELTTASTGPTINISNYNHILKFVINTINLQPIDEHPETVSSLYGSGVYGTSAVEGYAESLGLTEVYSEYRPDEGVTYVGYSCDNFGEYVFIDSPSVYGGGGGQLKQCSLSTLNGGLPLNGSFYKSNSIIKYPFNPGSIVTTSYNQLTLTDSDDRRHMLTGIHSVRYGYRADEQWAATHFVSQKLAGETRINVMSLKRTSGAENGGDSAEIWQRTLQGSLDIQAPETGNKPLQVEITKMLSSPYSNTCYLTGELSIEAGDGSKLFLNADNGDPDSFQIELYDGSVTQAFTMNWSAENALMQLTIETPHPSGLPIKTDHTSPEICQ